MTIQFEKENHRVAEFSNAVYASAPAGLAAIHEAEKNIAICERDTGYLKAAAATMLQVLEEDLKISGAPNDIMVQLDEWALHKDSSDIHVWVEDAKSLVQLFAQISGINDMRVLVAKVNHNMCRRFHTDINDLRLLCTYTGPGTIWLPEEIVDRKALESYKDNDCIVLDERLVQQAQTGAVVILKGAIYPSPNTRACVHRSPTVTESGALRLLLRIDTNEFLKDLN
jgi:hypothetical protein